jgi:hypothetical protein
MEEHGFHAASASRVENVYQPEELKEVLVRAGFTPFRDGRRQLARKKCAESSQANERKGTRRTDRVHRGQKAKPGSSTRYGRIGCFALFSHSLEGPEADTEQGLNWHPVQGGPLVAEVHLFGTERQAPTACPLAAAMMQPHQ